jgi:DNA modification methylase
VTPYYDEDGITIYHGDCREIDAWLTADVLVTDPPYGVAFHTGMDHRAGTDRSRDRSVSGDADTGIRDAALDLWGWRPALVFGSWKATRPANTRMLLTWCKGLNCGMGDLSIPWKPNTEEVYVLGTGFVGHRGSSVLNFQAPVSQVSWGRRHPTEKPEDLMRELIGKCPPGVIADPFMGSGTTLRAAKDLGRKAIGIEIEERYCEIAAKRLAQGVLDFGEAS